MTPTVNEVWLIRTNSGSDLLQLLEGNWWPQATGLLCLVVLIWLVVRLIARVNEDTDPAAADREMLMTMTELHREGDLAPDEFRSIKGQLVRRLKAPTSVREADADDESSPAAVAGDANDNQPVDSAQSAPADKTTETENIDDEPADNHRRHEDHRSDDASDH